MLFSEAVSSSYPVGALVGLAAALAVGSCILPFDDYDPRLGDPATSTGGASTGSGGTAGSGGTNTGTGGTAGTAGSGTSTGGGGTAGAGGAPVLVVEYVAAVADCVDAVLPDPDVCETQAGFGNMDVDLLESSTGHPDYAFLRFDLDGTLAGRTVVGVTLRLVVTDHVDADSDNSGEIWPVTPFDRSDLFSTVPTQVGSSPVGLSQGAVVQNQTVEWSLPSSLVAANESTHLGVFPLTNQGVNYWNAQNGTIPPRLIIDYQ